MQALHRVVVALLVAASVGIPSVLAGKCKPPQRCFQSLSEDPFGAAPYCTSILDYPTAASTTTRTQPASSYKETIVGVTVAVTKTVVTGTRTLDGPTDLWTSTTLGTVTKPSTVDTATLYETVSTPVTLTSPVVQTSVDVTTIDNTVIVYRSLTRIIETTTTTVATQTIGEYGSTLTEYLATKTDVVVTVVPRAVTEAIPQGVPIPTYLSTCDAEVVTSACKSLYPSPITDVVTKWHTPIFFRTDTRYVTAAENQEATVTAAPVTQTVFVLGTTTIWETVTAIKIVTQIIPFTTVIVPTSVVVVKSTVVNDHTETEYTKTVTDFLVETATSIHTRDLGAEITTITSPTLLATKTSTSYTLVPTISNAEFESDPSGYTPWKKYAAYEVGVDLSHNSCFEGQSCLRVNFPEASNARVRGITQALNAQQLVANRQYRFTASVKLQAMDVATTYCEWVRFTCAIASPNAFRVLAGFTHIGTDSLDPYIGTWNDVSVICQLNDADMSAVNSGGSWAEIQIFSRCNAYDMYVDNVRAAVA